MLEVSWQVEEYPTQVFELVYQAALKKYSNLQALDLQIINSRDMQSINNDTAGNDYSTDVLSFAYNENGPLFPHEPNGEIFICLEIARNQAQDNRHSLDYELAYLFAHGLLHVLGYDHQNPLQKKEMDHKTDELLYLAGINSLT